jgi:ArsR family transcriptional regulator, arsenate/arsenite/antimonite-responsive transcriptional repressor
MATETTLPDAVVLQRFQAVAEETRFRIVRLLSRGELCVCELQDELGAGQSRLSFHLRKLKDAGVVTDRREGRWVYYRLVPETLDEMRHVLAEAKPEKSWQTTTGRDGVCCD